MASKRTGASAIPKAAISSPVIPPPPSPPQQTITLKDLQDALAHVVKQMSDQFEQKNKEMREDILQALEGLAAHIERIDGRVDEMAENVLKQEERLERVEENVDVNQNEIIMAQYRDMEFALRIRGLKENVKENLKEDIVADLAVALECTPDEILRDVEKIFRVNSWVARQRNLPRDVVIYFSRRARRNEIIQAFYQQKFQIAAQDVIILKEIPPKILRRRKDYAFLVEELKKRQIPFRWDIPIGIVVNYLGTRYRLNTILKARDFYVSVLKAGSPPSPRRKRMEEMIAEVAAGAAGGPMVLNEGSRADFIQQPIEKEDPKGQRMTRAAYRRKEKEQQKGEGVFMHPIIPEPVGGTRPKRSIMDDLRGVFQRHDATKDG